MAGAELKVATLEYEGRRVPLVWPNPVGVSMEYRSEPLTQGIIIDGVVQHNFSKATQADTVFISRLPTAVLEALPKVIAAPAFASSTTWEYVGAQYLNRDTGDILNIVHRLNGANWEGEMFFPAGFTPGFLDKRSVIIRNTGGNELILLPTDFIDGESLVLYA